ncbi:MAG: DUF4400 domain-containing protein [Nitrosomonas sp.]|nr:DUF4400 domain-containing protein [Nitrosomonas sp.]
MAGLIATWFLIPRQVLEQTRIVDRQQMASLAGDNANHWVNSKASESMLEFSGELAKAASFEITDELKGWVLDRIYITLLWSDIVFYRVYSFALWILIAFPILLAASSDGVLVREIRKNMFISQSPLRLSIGANLFVFSFALLLLWLFMPFPLPAILAPCLILLVVFSLWMWMSNIQKRI